MTLRIWLLQHQTFREQELSDGLVHNEQLAFGDHNKQSVNAADLFLKKLCSIVFQLYLTSRVLF